MLRRDLSFVRFCYCPGCGNVCDNDKWFCLYHWKRVSAEQQAALFAARDAVVSCSIPERYTCGDPAAPASPRAF